MQSITSRQNPLVRACRDLAATPAADGARVLLDGTHLVRAALSAGIEIELLLVASSRLMRETEEGALALDLERRLVQVVQASDSIVATASPVRTSSGILAIARRTQAVTARDVFSHPQACVVAAVDIQDPGNVGALLRVAEAGGATGACVGGASANPFSWRALRGSMGSALRLPVVIGAMPGALVDSMSEAGLRTIAAIPRGGQDPDAIDWRGRIALLLGGEGQGLDAALVDRCHARVTIPMAQSVESLNVAAAGAILIYAARRQRA